MPPEIFPLRGRRVYIAGHTGMVGSACLRHLAAQGCEIITTPRQNLDLRRQAETEAFIAGTRPDAILIAAALVGGIQANNDFPADFLYDNLLIQANIIQAAHRTGVNRLLFLGSSCIYPREALQPIAEEALLTGPLEPTNQWYAVAKIAGVKLCQAYRRQHGRDYIAVMPCNLYGPGDYFNAERSHVIPALLQRFHVAATTNAAAVTCWGSGAARREFMHVNDLATACGFLLRHYSGELPINAGTGRDISIHELATEIAAVTGFTGEILWDRAKPDGAMLKRMDVARLLAMGWRPEIEFGPGLQSTYQWFMAQDQLRG